MSAREEAIRARLLKSFAPQECHLIDESAMHVGHAGAASGAGHYRLHIVARAFQGHNRVARHRLIYACLQDMMQTEIHALTITALTAAEAAASAKTDS